MRLSTSDDIRHVQIEGQVTLDDRMLKDLQKTLLEMLNDIQDVCEEEGIRYVLCGGTALGAYRHKGFIPWDDDIDVMMPRPDYDRFIAAFAKKQSSKYWIHIPGVTDDYALLFTHIRLKGTSVKTRDDMNTDECGACIDVFPVENIYDNKIARFFQGLGCDWRSFMISCRKFYRDREFLTDLAEKSGNGGLKFKTKIRIFIGRILKNKNIKGMAQKADRRNSKLKDKTTTLVSIPTGRRHFWGEIYSPKTVCDGKPLEFEGRFRLCPAGIEEYLGKLYGDYLTIPPESDREKHIYFKPFFLKGGDGK